jgi:hypothetical protein
MGIPGYIAGVESEAFHSDVFLDTDGEAVERADRFAVRGEVVVEVRGTG